MKCYEIELTWYWGPMGRLGKLLELPGNKLICSLVNNKGNWIGLFHIEEPSSLELVVETLGSCTVRSALPDETSFWKRHKAKDDNSLYKSQRPR
jgi:hypothetical protein